MTVPDTVRTRRWPSRILLVALMVPNLAACWLAAKVACDVATDRYLGFSNLYAAGALLAVVILALATIGWLAIVTWNSAPPQRARRLVAFSVAGVVLWAAAVILALSVADHSY